MITVSKNQVIPKPTKPRRKPTPKEAQCTLASDQESTRRRLIARGLGFLVKPTTR